MNFELSLGRFVGTDENGETMPIATMVGSTLICLAVVTFMPWAIPLIRFN